MIVMKIPVKQERMLYIRQTYLDGTHLATHPSRSPEERGMAEAAKAVVADYMGLTYVPKLGGDRGPDFTSPEGQRYHVRILKSSHHNALINEHDELDATFIFILVDVNPEKSNLWEGPYELVGTMWGEEAEQLAIGGLREGEPGGYWLIHPTNLESALDVG